jgi:hypothetical protein
MQAALTADQIIVFLVSGIDLGTIDAFRTCEHALEAEVDKACHRLFLAGFSEDETFLLALKVRTGRAVSNICRLNGA